MGPKWQDILDEVSGFQEKCRGDGSRAWFRGHACTKWRLRSKLHREVDKFFETLGERPSEHDRIGLLYEQCRTLYRRFAADAWALLSDRERSDWGIVFSMEHYGIPTRLLDWTESFACALFFAQRCRKRQDEGAIYVLNPQRLNQVSCGREGLISLGGDIRAATFDTTVYHPKTARKPDAKALSTIAVSPYLTNPRMIAQRSAFTLGGDSFQSLDNEFNGRLVNEGFLKKITLPEDTFDDAQRFIELVGSGEYGYFPDLEGLQRKYDGDMQRTLELACSSIRCGSAEEGGSGSPPNIVSRR